MADQIRYDLLTQQALRGVVRSVLTEAAKKKSLPGDHHFYIAFDTQADGVRMSDRLRAQYPEEMTIILQHQFWDLSVDEEGIRGRPVVRRHPGKARHPVRGDQRLLRSLGAVRTAIRGRGRGPGDAFPGGERQDKNAAKGPRPVAAPRTPAAVTAQPAPNRTPAETDQPSPKPAGGGGEVVRLDRFRKK